MNIRPRLLRDTAAPKRRERVFAVPDTLDCFVGHFPGFPVAPAVVQISWVMDVARAMLPSEPVLAHIEVLKFKAPIRPGDTVHLSAELSADGSILQFRLWNAERLFASGRLLFVPARHLNP